MFRDISEIFIFSNHEARNGRGTPYALNHELNIEMNVRNEYTGIKNSYFDILHAYGLKNVEVIFLNDHGGKRAWHGAAHIGLTTSLIFKKSAS